MADFEEYSDLSGVGFESKEQTKPEDEFFHSAYISGQSRKNHIGVVEKIGQLQIRGVEYNLNEIYGIITHTKQVLVKTVRKNNQDKTECFSYCDGAPPWKSTSGRMCGKNAAERVAIEFCAPCKSQIIVAMIRTDKEGTIIPNEKGKATFIFIKGKGIKYQNVSSYLSDLSKMDMDPLFTPVTEESKKLEKSVGNNKRFITKITVGTANSQYGIKNVFDLSREKEISKETAKKVLDIAKENLPKFNDKFDWTKTMSSTQATGYQQAVADSGISTFSELGNSSTNTTTDVKQNHPLSFDDINF